MPEGATLITLADIARIAHVGRPAVSNWRRRYTDFPEPREETRAGPRFDLTEVEAWLAKRGKLAEKVPVGEHLWRTLDALRGVQSVERHLETTTAFLAYVHVATTSPELVPERLRWERLRDLPQATATDGLHAAAHLIEAHRSELRDLLIPGLGSITDEQFTLLQTLDGLVREHAAPDLFEALLLMYEEGRARLDAEFVTPSDLRELVVRLPNPDVSVVYDGALGCAGFFVTWMHHQERGAPRFVGQEINPGTWRLARRRLSVHGVAAEIGLGNTLWHDQHGDLPADVVFLDPPYNMHLEEELPTDDPRWIFGRPPPGNANTAWLQHAVAHLSPEGRAFVVLPAGSLFGGGRERDIRRELVRRGAVDAVIALPPGMKPSTSIPLAIWVLRPPADSGSAGGQILFVDASAKGQRLGRLTTLDAQDRMAIVDAYRQWQQAPNTFKPSDGFTEAVPVDEVLAGGCNLVPSRWVQIRELRDPAILRWRLNEATDVWAEATTELTPPTDPRQLSGRSVAGQPPQRRRVDELIRTGELDLVAGPHIPRDALREHGTPVLGRGLTDEEIRRPTRFVDLDDIDPKSIALTRPGDVVFTGTLPSLRAVVDEDGGHVVAAPGQILRIRRGFMDPHALAACLQSRLNKRYASGVSVLRVNVRDLEVPVLTPETQRQLALGLSSLWDYQARLQAALESTNALADVLVDAVVTGTLLDQAEPPTHLNGSQIPDE